MNSPAIIVPPTRNILLRILPFTVIIFCGYLPVGMPLAALPLQIHDTLGFGNVTVGITIGCQSLVTLLTRQFAGNFCDRRGAKFGVMLGGAMSIVASTIYLASTMSLFGPYSSLALLVAARVASGLAESLLMTGALAWAIGVVGIQNTGKVMVWVGIGLYAAIAAGAPIGIALMAAQGAFGGFAAVSLGMIAFSVLTTAAAAFIPAVAPLGGERLPFLKVVGHIAPFGAGLALATLAFGAIGAFAALDFQHQGWSGAGFRADRIRHVICADPARVRRMAGPVWRRSRRDVVASDRMPGSSHVVARAASISGLCRHRPHRHRLRAGVSFVRH